MHKFVVIAGEASGAMLHGAHSRVQLRKCIEGVYGKCFNLCLRQRHVGEGLDAEFAGVGPAAVPAQHNVQRWGLAGAQSRDHGSGHGLDVQTTKLTCHTCGKRHRGGHVLQLAKLCVNLEIKLARFGCKPSHAAVTCTSGRLAEQAQKAAPAAKLLEFTACELCLQAAYCTTVLVRTGVGGNHACADCWTKNGIRANDSYDCAVKLRMAAIKVWQVQWIYIISIAVVHCARLL